MGARAKDVFTLIAVPLVFFGGIKKVFKTKKFLLTNRILLCIMIADALDGVLVLGLGA